MVVDGGYHPPRVLARAGMPLRIVFDRREDNACSERVVFPGTGVEASLAAHASTAVDLPPLSPGVHEFTCGMGMLHGDGRGHRARRRERCRAPAGRGGRRRPGGGAPRWWRMAWPAPPRRMRQNWPGEMARPPSGGPRSPTWPAA